VPGEMIPIVLFMMMGLVGVSFSPLGRALARRVGGADQGEASEVEALRGEVAELRRELDDMYARLDQLQELENRVDFAERVLAQAKERGALGAPKANA